MIVWLKYVIDSFLILHFLILIEVYLMYGFPGGSDG